MGILTNLVTHKRNQYRHAALTAVLSYFSPAAIWFSQLNTALCTYHLLWIDAAQMSIKAALTEKAKSNLQQ